MIGAAIGAVAGIAGSLIGGAKASKAAKRARRMLDKKEKENQAWYDRRYNEDYTQSAEAQAALSNARKYAQDAMSRAEGTQAVMGGTDEAMQSARTSANNMIADATTTIASQATARKDAIEQQYRQTKDAITDAKIGIQNQQAANSSQAGSQVLNAGLDMAMADAQAHLDGGRGLFESMFKKKDSTTTEGGK